MIPHTYQIFQETTSDLAMIVRWNRAPGLRTASTIFHYSEAAKAAALANAFSRGRFEWLQQREPAWKLVETFQAWH